MWDEQGSVGSYVRDCACSDALLMPVQVLSGQLYAPGVPDTAELVEMRKLVDTYGKTWHTWQVDRGDTLPLGDPCWPPSCSLLRPSRPRVMCGGR